ncbi:MAG: hypothetical protein KAR00_00505 [Candidatus Pacebacteria bacterium]|nr:hypothetical protein [Candidatus Paceibacterota bacterium]
MEKKKILNFIFFFSILIFTFCIFGKANAASLYFSPSSGSHLVGQTFSVNVYVSSSDQAMNAASGVVFFSSDKLQVTSVSKANSIFSLWVQEPTFSNIAGNITFEGIVLNPGFIGQTGKILTINFKAKSAGNVSLAFNSGSVLANDGQGTNILSVMSSAQFDLNPSVTGQTAPKATTPTVIGGAPTAPDIISSTHSDANKWYPNNTPEFSWDVPSDVTAVKLLIGKLPIATPTVLYTPVISEKKIDEMLDGTYYFHVCFKNKYGWGGITHRKVLIDTQPPKAFDIKFPGGKEDDNPQPEVLFKTIDLMSGIDHYKVKIGEGDYFIASQLVTSNLYTLPIQSFGKRSIIVQAYDKAGNYTTATEEFTVLAIKTPKITECPTKLIQGDILIIKGETYPDATVTIWLKKKGEEAIAQDISSNNEGKFEFVAKEVLDRGVYRIWAEVTDSRGAKSHLTNEYVIAVKSRFLDTIISLLTSYLSLIILLIIIIFTLLSLVWLGWHRFSALKKKLKKEVKEAEDSLRKAFDLLKEDIQKQIEFLDKTKFKRELTKVEEKVIKHLKKDLDDAESFIKKEIKDIGKQIE